MPKATKKGKGQVQEPALFSSPHELAPDARKMTRATAADLFEPAVSSDEDEDLAAYRKAAEEAEAQMKRQRLALSKKLEEARKAKEKKRIEREQAEEKRKQDELRKAKSAATRTRVEPPTAGTSGQQTTVPFPNASVPSQYFVELDNPSVVSSLSKLGKAIMREQVKSGVDEDQIEYKTQPGDEPEEEYVVPVDGNDRLQRAICPIQIVGPTWKPDGLLNVKFPTDQMDDSQKLSCIVDRLTAIEVNSIAIMQNLQCLYRNQDLHSIGILENLARVETIRDMVGGKVLDRQAHEIVRQSRRYLIMRSSRALSSIPFSVVEEMEEFFLSEDRVLVMAQFILMEIPIDQHFPAAVSCLLLHPSLHEKVNWSNKTR